MPRYRICAAFWGKNPRRQSLDYNDFQHVSKLMIHSDPNRLFLLILHSFVPFSPSWCVGPGRISCQCCCLLKLASLGGRDRKWSNCFGLFFRIVMYATFWFVSPPPPRLWRLWLLWRYGRTDSNLKSHCWRSGFVSGAVQDKRQSINVEWNETDNKQEQDDNNEEDDQRCCCHNHLLYRYHHLKIVMVVVIIIVVK